MAFRHRRWAGGDVYIADPFLCHQRPSMLYVRDRVGCFHMSNQSAIHAWWSTLHASSRSLLVTWPSGLPQETSCAVMSTVKIHPPYNVVRSRGVRGCGSSARVRLGGLGQGRGSRGYFFSKHISRGVMIAAEHRAHTLGDRLGSPWWVGAADRNKKDQIH